MAAIKDIYEEYKLDVFKYLLSLTGNPTLSEDLVSETFLGAMKSLPGFKGDSTIKTWLFSIARYKWYEYLRGKKDEVSFDDLAINYLEDKSDIESEVEDHDMAEKIKELLQEEPERTRDIILMRIKGYSFHEISLEHKISESSARVIDFRGKKKIRERLEKEGIKNG